MGYATAAEPQEQTGIRAAASEDRDAREGGVRGAAAERVAAGRGGRRRRQAQLLRLPVAARGPQAAGEDGHQDLQAAGLHVLQHGLQQPRRQDQLHRGHRPQERRPRGVREHRERRRGAQQRDHPLRVPVLQGVQLHRQDLRPVAAGESAGC